MKIAIDARVIEKSTSGISRYLQGFLDELKEVDAQNEYYLLCYWDLPELRNKGYQIVATGRSNLMPERVYNLYWLEMVLPRLLKRYNIDVFWNPNHYLPIGKGLPKSMISIHDMSHVKDKSYKGFVYRFVYLDFILPRSVKKTDLILTISENSKDDILKHYFADEKGDISLIGSNKVKVIYEAADERFKERGKKELSEDFRKGLMNKYQLPEDFVLYVGRIEKRKNIEGIIEVAKLMPETKFVLVGEGGYAGFEELGEEIEKRDNILWLNFVEDKDLPYLYNLAKVFFFPSFYEGFGLPVLEAMQSGLPVVASSTSSLPEVIGKAGLMHSPDNYKAFVEDISKLLKNKSFYKRIKEECLKRAEEFSWKKSANQLVSLITSLYQD